MRWVNSERSHSAPSRPEAGTFSRSSPRAIVRWDVFKWEPVTIAPDYAATRRIIDPTAPVPGYSPTPLRAGRGRHRRT
ncbi:DUF6087 family protein [Streptomyces nojiriensis]|uniref:DUF6087 family protein n=1 Tax=Streptomyces nojiriensis TaxID=66374 RepID=UPI002E175C96